MSSDWQAQAIQVLAIESRERHNGIAAAVPIHSQCHGEKLWPMSRTWMIAQTYAIVTAQLGFVIVVSRKDATPLPCKSTTLNQECGLKHGEILLSGRRHTSQAWRSYLVVLLMQACWNHSLALLSHVRMFVYRVDNINSISIQAAKQFVYSSTCSSGIKDEEKRTNAQYPATATMM